MTNAIPTETVELRGIPIFRPGVYGQGEFDDAFVETLADNYDPEFHEAPNYLTHTDDTGRRRPTDLAFGWIKRLFVKGNVLFADFADVPRRFAELILAGRIKKRSVEIYPDLNGRGPYLRAVAWPLVPEIKALADVHPTQVFNDDCEFHEIAFEAKETNMSEENQFITRDEVQAICQRLRDELLGEYRKTLIEMEVKTFCEQMVASGKMTPAERDSEQPLLIAQRQNESAMTFAENETPLSERRMDYYRHRSAVVAVRSNDASPSNTDRPNPNEQKLLRYFHDNEAFFSRTGIAFDDLAAAERYETEKINPLVA